MCNKTLYGRRFSGNGAAIFHATKGGVFDMVNIICALIAAAATVICGWIAANTAKAEKTRKEDEVKQEKRSEQRSKEARLQLAMIAANSALTVGVAMALKHGHTNGEVEEGLAAVENANAEYTKFLNEVAIDHIKENEH